MKYGKLPPKGDILDGNYPINSGYRIIGYCDKKNCNKGTILVVARGVGGCGDVKITHEDCYLTNLSISIEIDESICRPYYFYYLHQIKNLSHLNSGSAQPQITIDSLLKYPIKIPSIIEQDRIITILSSLDAKIENNNKINANLEAQAAALFKSWFVDFEPFKDGEFVESELGMIPKGWKVGTLLDYNSIVMGQSPSGSSYNEEQIGCEFYQGCADFGLRFPRKRVYTTEPNRYAESNSVLMSVRAPVGTLNVARHRCCIGRGLASIKSNIGCDSYTLYLMKSIKNILDTFNGDGTVFGSINKKSLECIKVIVPSLSVIKNYEAKINPLDSYYRKNSDENQRLSSLRDTLLPKLMSGEIDLDNIKL